MKRIILSVAVIAAAASVVAVSASAERQQVIANPATACKALVQYPQTGYTDFGTCVSTIWQGVAAFRSPSDEDPNVLLSLDQRCAQFEAGVTDPESGQTFRFTYPGFLLDEGPGWPFVTFTINDHAQCELALYTYHTLATAVFGGEG